MKNSIIYHLLLGFMIILNASCTNSKNILVLSNIFDEETDSLLSCLSHDPQYKVSKASLTDLPNLDKYSLIWYHRVDSAAIDSDEFRIGGKVKKYLSKGGKLILSMDGVRLLNAWEIEKNRIQATYYDAVDDGYGRQLGFHSFKSHPLFDNLNGGAYTWQGKSDNKCRVLGFFDDQLPSNQDSKVIGCLWEYIYYRPEQKVIWYTPYGKGSILNIGCALYFSPSNFNKDILDCFSFNCVRFMTGKKCKSLAKYWSYDTPKTIEKNYSYEYLDRKKSHSWIITPDSNALSRMAQILPYDLSNRRSMVVGKEPAGIEEIWYHPFMAVRDLYSYLKFKSCDTLIPLTSLIPKIELRPNGLIRTYSIGKFSLKEIITNPVLDPLTGIHYEWSGNELSQIIFSFRSNLRLMWPYDQNATGSIYYGWNTNLNAFLISDQNQENNVLIGGNCTAQLLDKDAQPSILTKRNRKEKNIFQVSSVLSFQVDTVNAMDLLVIGGIHGLDESIDLYRKRINDCESIFQESDAFYKDYANQMLSINTPDSLFNQGLYWSILSSIQFLVETPGIGTSLMAGYGSSRRGWGGGQKISGRPGYAWYFGRDSEWSGFAFDCLGDYETVRNILETLIRFQNVNGKIFHELTTSGSVHYDASDATPLFIILFAHYIKSSGDIQFLKKNRDALSKALNYCYSTDTDGDGLIEISNVGHGWLEGGELFGSKTEFYLVGCWAKALEEASYLFGLLDDKYLKEKYNQDAIFVRNKINIDFWNEKGYYNYGLYSNGVFTKPLIVLPVVPILLQVTDADKSLQIVCRIGESDFSTDWGVRLIGMETKDANPSVYHSGSIWPLFTGWTSLAEYQVGRYLQGFERIVSSMQSYRALSLGRVPEVIHGNFYKTTGVTSHQCWSETMVIQPAIEGLLGFVPDALNNTMYLSPRFPFDWSFCSVKNIKMGSVKLAMEMKKEKGKCTYHFSSNENLSLNFKPTFPLNTKIHAVYYDGHRIEYIRIFEKEYFSVEVDLAIRKDNKLAFEYDEGVSALPSQIYPINGSINSGFRILEQILDKDRFIISLEGKENTTEKLRLYLPKGFKNISEPCKMDSLGNGVYELNVKFPQDTSLYKKKKVVIDL